MNILNSVLSEVEVLEILIIHQVWKIMVLFV